MGVMSNPLYKRLSNLSFVMGFASILAAIAIWFLVGGSSPTAEERIHSELFSIFVGLWAPTFFILSIRLDRCGE